MRYWWVNQNQTFAHETKGGYLWSPKRKQNNSLNPFYEFMREVAPDDIIFSFADTLIKTIGIARSNAYEAPKPLEFGQAGAYWDQIGWRVDVSFIPIKHAIRPSEHIERLKPFLPQKYSPLRAVNGHGLQSVYLTAVPESLAFALVDLIGREARDIVEGLRLSDVVRPIIAIGLAQWEEHELAKVVKDKALTETERQAVVLARRGQGLFKQNVMKRERQCRLTLVDRSEHLRASHCKPWRDSTNEERLAGDNGLLLTPDADHLFDRGYISFDDNGDVLVSPVAHHDSLVKMGLDPASLKNVGSFSSGQGTFLKFHREQVFLKSSLTP
jgi:putative restriction endonuclease